MQIIGLSQQKLAKPKIRNVYGLSNRPSRNDAQEIGGTMPANIKSQLLPNVGHKILSRDHQIEMTYK